MQKQIWLNWRLSLFRSGLNWQFNNSTSHCTDYVSDDRSSLPARIVQHWLNQHWLIDRSMIVSQSTACTLTGLSIAVICPVSVYSNLVSIWLSRIINTCDWMCCCSIIHHSCYSLFNWKYNNNTYSSIGGYSIIIISTSDDFMSFISTYIHM